MNVLILLLRGESVSYYCMSFCRFILLLSCVNELVSIAFYVNELESIAFSYVNELLSIAVLVDVCF